MHFLKADVVEGQNEISKRLKVIPRYASVLPLVGLAFSSFVLIGALGGALGVILPGQIAYYHVNKSVIGLIFFAFSSGYFLSATCAGLFTLKLGQRWYLLTGMAIMLVTTGAYSLKPPFMLVLIINLLLGFGSAILDAGFNAAVTGLPDRTKLLNYLHAFYGIGALIGPIVAAVFLTIGWEWNTVFIVLCSLSLLLFVSAFVFLHPTSPDASSQVAEAYITENALVTLLKHSTVWLAALFLFIYVGIEGSLGSWGYSFLLENRHLGTLLGGWIVSAYWLSLTLGRFFINTLSERLGMNTAGMVYGCLVGIVVGGMLTWFIPVVQMEALGFCLLGFFLGPIYPTTIAIVPRLVAGRLVPGTIGLIIGVSIIGGALFPWLVGILAQYIGIWTLLPSTLILALILLLNWWAVTRQLATAHSQIPQ